MPLPSRLWSPPFPLSSSSSSSRSYSLSSSRSLSYHPHPHHLYLKAGWHLAHNDDDFIPLIMKEHHHHYDKYLTDDDDDDHVLLITWELQWVEGSVTWCQRRTRPPADSLLYSTLIHCSALLILYFSAHPRILYFTLIHCSALYTLQCIILHRMTHAYLWPLHILLCLAACSYPGQLHLISLCSIQTKRKSLRTNLLVFSSDMFACLI